LCGQDGGKYGKLKNAVNILSLRLSFAIRTDHFSPDKGGTGIIISKEQQDWFFGDFDLKREERFP
jgi:hypothetical protein